MLLLLRFSLLISVFFFTQVKSYSYNDTTGVAFIAYWSIGDTYSYEVKKYSQQWKGDDLVKNDSSSYTAEFTVLDSTETSYQIKWSYTNELYRSNTIPTEVLKSLSIKPIFEIIYSTDEYGEFKSIDNWEEVRESVNEIFDQLIPVLSEGSNAKEGIENTLLQMKNSYQSKIGIEAFVVPELRLIHFPFGSALEVDSKYEYEDSLPNLFGINPVDAQGVLYLDEVDFEEGYCLLVQEVQLEEKSSKSMIMDFFRLSGLDTIDVEVAVEGAILEINDYNRYGVYFYPGVLDFVHTTRESYFQYLDDEASRRDTVIIVLK
ncbi:MAG: hypothetical protein ACXIUD_00265 [Mongoliitalea sp.]